MNDQQHGTQNPSLTPDDVAGVWRSEEPGDPYLELDSAGKAWGTDGANGINTSYTLDGSIITLEPWISTMRAVSGVNPWLRFAHTGLIEGTTMTVRDREGAVVGTLTHTSGNASSQA